MRLTMALILVAIFLISGAVSVFLFLYQTGVIG